MCRNIIITAVCLLLLMVPATIKAQSKPWSTPEDSVGYWQMLFNREMGQTILYCIDSVEVKSRVLWATNDSIKFKLQIKNKRKNDIGLLYHINNQRPKIDMTEKSRNGQYYIWLDYGVYSGDLLPRLIRLKRNAEISRTYVLPKNLLPKDANYTNAIGFALSYCLNINGLEYLINSKQDVVGPLKESDTFRFYYNMRTNYFGYFNVYSN